MTDDWLVEADLHQIIDALTGDLDAAERQLERIADLHHRRDNADECHACDAPWPCKTRRLAERKED